MHSTTPSKLQSLMPLAWAGLFMLCGILVLVYLGRDTARLMNNPLGEVDLAPLLYTEESLSGDVIRDKVHLIHFWGTWCGPCREEFPEFVDLYKMFRDDPDVKIVSVSCSPGPESSIEKLRQETQEYLETVHSEIPTHCDSAMYTRTRLTQMLAAGGFAYPFTILIDQQGIVRDFYRGYRKGTMEKIAEQIVELKRSASVD